MIITRTPYRMSFFGGGTDYPAHFLEHGGAVLATTINRYCYISCRWLPPFFAHKSRIAYSHIETVASNRDIQHPSVRAVLERLGVEDGIEVHHDGDLPARTGLGSSSAFTVGLLHAVKTLQGQILSKMDLAREAICVEQEMLRENVGCQDQVMAAVGGLQRIDFSHEDIRCSPIVASRARIEELQKHLLLYFTGFSRTASDVAAEQIKCTPQLTAELTAMHKMVGYGQEVLCSSRDIADLGKLLHESWLIKRGLTSKITTSAVDDIYDAARVAGAIGGKLMGAGGGGFMLLFARPEHHAAIQQALGGLLRVPFRFEHDGTQVVVYQPDEEHR